PSYGQSIVDYDIRSKGAEVYLELAKEVLADGE
ncbi:MAG TPA: ParA family protein, partial [Trichococcus flocculiformis]|nr:ParA family protein [Trichococcus flocculiformis]